MKYESTPATFLAKVGKCTLTGVSATLITMAWFAPALSAAPGAVPSVTVKYDASKANTDSGALELYGQLMFAAQKVCPVGDWRNPYTVGLSQHCQKEAVERAVGQLHNRRLVEIAAAHANRG